MTQKAPPPLQLPPSTPGISIAFNDLALQFDDSTIFKDLHGEFRGGSLTGVMGPNGSGKTSFLRLLAGELQPQSGKIQYRHLTPSRDVVYLPTQYELDRSSPIQVADLIQMGFASKLGFWNTPSAIDWEQYSEIIEYLDLQTILNKSLRSISSGQYQRILLARIYLQNPAVILLDEPFNTLDSKSTAALLKLLHLWQAQGKIILVVTHQLSLIKENFPYLFYISPQFVAQGPSHFVLGNLPKSSPHSKGVEI